jgi:hypothetical protein
MGDGHCESFNGKPCKKRLNAEIFYSLRMMMLTTSVTSSPPSSWRGESSTVRTGMSSAHGTFENSPSPT